MEPSKVYFTNLRVHNGDSLQKKLERLIRRAGIETIDFNGRYAALKSFRRSPAIWPISVPITRKP